MIPNSHHREIIIRALQSYEEDLCFNIDNCHPDKAEWSKTELADISEMRKQLKLED